MPDPSIAEKAKRPLEGCRVGISISESEELATFGLTPDAINIVTVDLARRIMALGGSVLLGHDWRTGGVMEAVARFAISYAGQNASPEQPLIINYLAEPDRPNLSAADRITFETIASLETFSWAKIPRDALDIHFEKAAAASPGLVAERDLQAWRGIVAEAGKPSDDPLHQRRLDLTAMRYYLAEKCDVRIVLGGKTLGYQGLAPGIVEEAWCQLCLGKRLIVCEGMGGAALGISQPETKPARAMLEDTKHPLAKTFLEALYARKGREESTVKVVKGLHVEAILRSLLPQV